MKSCFQWLTVVCLVIAMSAHAEPPTLQQKMLNGARQQIGVTVSYDGSYRPIAYPNGDVPKSTGVCSDVVIRAYRSAGIDLQQLVHEDMRQAFSRYPRRWGLRSPDRNIDHRRVPNLAVFFTRHGTRISPTTNARDYLPGDIVTWESPGGLPHVGIVDEQRSDGRRLIIHNIGRGTVREDTLFAFPITGHFRYPR